jgi:hypothetical protein
MRKYLYCAILFLPFIVKADIKNLHLDFGMAYGNLNSKLYRGTNRMNKFDSAFRPNVGLLYTNSIVEGQYDFAIGAYFQQTRYSVYEERKDVSTDKVLNTKFMQMELSRLVFPILFINHIGNENKTYLFLNTGIRINYILNRKETAFSNPESYQSHYAADSMRTMWPQFHFGAFVPINKFLQAGFSFNYRLSTISKSDYFIEKVPGFPRRYFEDFNFCIRMNIARKQDSYIGFIEEK